MRQGNSHIDTEKYFYPKEIPVVWIYVYQILHFMADLTWQNSCKNYLQTVSGIKESWRQKTFFGKSASLF